MREYLWAIFYSYKTSIDNCSIIFTPQSDKICIQYNTTWRVLWSIQKPKLRLIIILSSSLPNVVTQNMYKLQYYREGVIKYTNTGKKLCTRKLWDTFPIIVSVHVRRLDLLSNNTKHDDTTTLRVAVVFGAHAWSIQCSNKCCKYNFFAWERREGMVQMMRWRYCSNFYVIGDYNTIGICVMLSCLIIDMGWNPK